MKFPKALKSRKLLIFAIVLCAFVGFFFLLNDVIMPEYVHQGGQVTVATVVGMKFDRAQQYLDSMGLDARQGEMRADNKYPIGVVISQNPMAGKMVNHGRRIYLTISGGEKLVSIPNLKGKTVRDGTFDLDRVGLKLGTVEFAVSDDFPMNTIMSQSLQADLKVKRDTYLSVIVSQGRSGERVAVPDLRSKTLKEAGQILAALGLKLGNINYQPLPNFLPNTVIDQFPHATELVPPGQAIDIVVVQAEAKTGETLEN